MIRWQKPCWEHSFHLQGSSCYPAEGPPSPRRAQSLLKHTNTQIFPITLSVWGLLFSPFRFKE